MERTSTVYKTYVEILNRELVCAMGCTEPIAIAYCAAVARKALGTLPSEIDVAASGNIIKNVKSVIVPNTGGLRGIEAAAAIGALAGDAEAGLQVVSHVTPDEIAALPGYMEQTAFSVSAAESEFLLDIEVTVRAGGHFATVRAVQEHTNIVLVETDAGVLFSKDPDEDMGKDETAPDYTLLNVADICEFADTCELDDVRPILERQLACNCAIAEEGLTGSYGAGIGRVLLTAYGDDVRTRARAYAAAASDARMNGCDLPVVINSGSGNQGITASVPVWKYGKLMGADDDTILRAVCLSDLITIHQKTGIGRLSAYCGAVSAGVGAGCGIAWLRGADCEGISHTLENAVAMISGCICDGAKASCASKIAMGVDCGILGYDMYAGGNNFRPGDGILGADVEDTIRNVGVLAAQGMRETDRVILKIMTE